jgi:tetratricopeptide (TPR) repeat protein
LRALVGQESCALLDGRFSDFTRFAAEALHFGEALDHPDRLINYHGDGGISLLLQGRVDEAIEGISLVTDRVPPIYKALLSWPYAEGGRLSEAAALIDSIGGASLRDVPGGYARLYVLASLAPPCAALGDHELADRLYQELLPYRTQNVLGQVSTLGPVAHYLGVLAGVLGRSDLAEEHFTFACDLAERTGARGVLVRTHLEWSQLLFARGGPGDVERAREMVAAALELAHELDVPVLAERASELLAAHGDVVDRQPGVW